MAPRLKCLPPGLATIDTRIAQPPPKRADPFYLTKPWRDLMRQLTAARGNVCQECGRSGVRLFGDHVQELKDGGAPLDPANIRLLCGSCHTKKTAKARAARMRERHQR
ncbi:HNH endonuclease signature motif containing protein [Acetobacter sp.]|uniref:HNH endonuclease signature motif containing protein n=1 Tax=Acetobacter sp. TaxID=440 RepID=UPI00338E1180